MRITLKFAAALAALWLVGAAQAQFTVLHNFLGTSGTNIGGANPYGDVSLSGSNMYGMTALGPPGGAIFRMNTDGTGYSLIYQFVGVLPFGNVTVSGTNLYGMTYNGGQSGDGMIFRVGADGSNFQMLHQFAGGANDGAHPYGSLTLLGDTLYGMTYQGGPSNVGVVFQINTNGNNFGVVHPFLGGTNDGALPVGDVTGSGSTLYGMTSAGGTANTGVVFQVNADGSGFNVMHSFLGSFLDAAGPQGDLTLSGTVLYGMAVVSAGGYLFVFQINTNGANYQLLSSIGGASPHTPWHNSLTQVGSTLYGMSTLGGASPSPGYGTIFQLNTNGTGVAVVHAFSSSDGAYPSGSVAFSGSALFGMTFEGGSNNVGTIFSYALPQPPSPPVLQITGIAVQTNDIQVSWLATAGTTNVVQATDGAADGSYTTNFTDISPMIFVTGGGLASTNYIDGGGLTNTSTSSRYYRIRLAP